jgi:preprotein translocase subunit SecG
MLQALNSTFQRFYEAVKYSERLAWATLWLVAALLVLAIILATLSELLDDNEKSF